ncbi:GNAT family N-acetyltransferase [Flagellimonas meishanensis]|uniref:GNAT family N-acetyltransferase n=1 Tax=Flagellimonas meishanensis TaxID=2873264 RepID=UPI001CA6A5BA|nr:GNAT family N-acetyltransferase [[Muricauda] meishanensis]
MSFECVRIDGQIKLVSICLNYAQEVFDTFDKDIIEFLPLDEPPQNIDETISFINSSMEQGRKGTDYVWTILHNEEFAGCCGIHSIQTKQPHFGLWIRKEMQGKGLGKKVVHHMLAWGIENLDVEYIKYPVDNRNKRSTQLIRDLGLSIHDTYEIGTGKKLQVDEYRYYKSKSSSSMKQNKDR